METTNMTKFEHIEHFDLRDQIALEVLAKVLKDTAEDVNQMYSDYEGYVENSVDSAYIHADAIIRRRQQRPE